MWPARVVGKRGAWLHSSFYRELLLLAIVLVMAVAHVAGRRDISHLSALRNRKHLAGMLAFDILELVFLISEFWSLIGVTL